MRTPVTDALNRLADQIATMTPKAREDLAKKLDKAGALKTFTNWTPQPGPQIEAYYNTADILLYGGAAGGGKSSLISGTALNQHTRVGIFRQQVGELQGLMDEMDKILLDAGYKAISRANNVWRGPDGKVVEFGHLEKPGAERNWQGREHDLKAVDEAANVPPAKILYISAWIRSSKPGQKKQLLLASNPPLGGVGDYLIEWFGPWLDPTHPLFGTVAPGELLWAYFEGAGDNITSVWVDAPTPAELRKLEDEMDAAMKAGDMDKVLSIKIPRSRTFIPAKLSDNKYLGPDYMAEIASKPEPLRTALLTGNFFLAQEDHQMQVIPASWVDAAMDRWDKRYTTQDNPMIHLATDVCGGGNDNQVSAGLRADWSFDPLVVTKGSDLIKNGAPSGELMGQAILAARRNGAALSVDATGGWGNAPAEYIEREQDQLQVERMVASAQLGDTSRDGKYNYANARASMWWTFREALDPDNNDPNEMPALPRDNALKRELCMPRWMLRARSTILIESKDDIRERLGRSTDRADAVIMAWYNRLIRAVQLQNRRENSNRARELRDPHAQLYKRDKRRGKALRRPF